MTGTITGIVVIPIVVVLSLALWLGMVYWAAAHPENHARRGALRPGAAHDRAAAVQEPPRARPAPADAEDPGKTGARAA
jgi:hypothetical protein